MPIESYLDDFAEDRGWDEALERVRADSSFGRALAHARHPKTKWRAIHYAAKFGQLELTKELIRHGAHPVLPVSGKRPVDLAKEGGHSSVVGVLYDVQANSSANWSPPEDSSLWPSSCWWESGRKTTSKEPKRIAYAGGIVELAAGETRFEDTYGRTLIGWHGTYNPPCGMDGDSVIS